jgi:hypothetical protein
MSELKQLKSTRTLRSVNFKRSIAPRIRLNLNAGSKNCSKRSLPQMTNPVTTGYHRSVCVQMNENEVTANFAGVLEKIRNGIEVIV